ncbi:zeta toxin family protein [Cellulomonas gelida]|uniref:zeta toxin family protein n=1 Tax=Cellulomonas gelida TaxID=1712 RepID=UPI00210042F6|nr:zeta toxin family protein [Cellulomonas gelida]
MGAVIVESFFESVVRDHSKGHAVTAPSSTTTRSPSYRYTTLADSTDRVRALMKPGQLLAVDSPYATVNNRAWFASPGRPRLARAELHEELVARALGDRTSASGRSRPSAIVLAGPPGAGKGTMRRQLLGAEVGSWLVVDADDFKRALLAAALEDGTYDRLIVPSETSLEVADAQSLSAAADALERQAKGAVDENTAAAALDEAAADRADASAAWDSAERRQDLAASLEHVDNRAAVDARLTADLDQGTPPAAAAAAGRAASRAGKAKGKARTRTANQRTAERSR